MKNNENRGTNNTFMIFEEDFDTCLDFKNDVKLSPSKIEQFFIENPELKDQINF